MNNLDRYGPLLDKLFDPNVAFDDIDLTQVPPEDLLFILQAVRSNAMLKCGLAQELAGQLSDIQSFAEKTEGHLYVLGRPSPYVH